MPNSVFNHSHDHGEDMPMTTASARAAGANDTPHRRKITLSGGPEMGEMAHMNTS